MTVAEKQNTPPISGNTRTSPRLGRTLLTALVVGSMVGSGVFSLPQNMAAKAGPLAIMVGWAITGVGMLALALVYQSLAVRKPALDAGPYAYARAGFGDFIGFNSAWGYWLSAWVGNVSYAVILFSALSYFVPVFGEGNTWQAILGASIVLWAIHALALAGIRNAAITNLITTVAKIAPIILFVAFCGLAFKLDIFGVDFPALAAPKLGDVLVQVKSTMLVTLWVFIGIEGASVYSSRAANRRDVGIATMAGFLICLVLYALVSLISLGIISQAELANLKNPSMAAVMERVVGSWGAILINLALVVSVLGAFLSWTLLAAEVPHIAAQDGMMPAFLKAQNSAGSPANALWVTNGLVQVLLIITYLANSTYLALLSIASVAILVPYVLSGAYALKIALTRDGYAPSDKTTGDVVKGAIATIYGGWLVYAADVKYLFMCAMLYAAGIVVYWWARREAGAHAFTPLEAVLALLIAATGCAAAYLIATGAISPL